MRSFRVSNMQTKIHKVDIKRIAYLGKIRCKTYVRWYKEGTHKARDLGLHYMCSKKIMVGLRCLLKCENIFILFLYLRIIK